MANFKDKKYLFLSVGLHLSFVLFFTIKSCVSPKRVNYQRSVRVDLVALPDYRPQKSKPEKIKPKKTSKNAKKENPKKKTKPPKVAASPNKEKVKPTKAKVAKTKNENSPKKTLEKSHDKLKDKQSSAVNRIEAMKRLKAKMAEKQLDEEGTPFKGNKTSEGASLTGVEKLQHDRYLEELDDHIKSFWDLPAFLQGSTDFKTIIVIKIDDQGNIIHKEMTTASDNALFNQAALDAIEKANPMPTPPEDLAAYLEIKGIELRFPE